jgi:hypothetical protein
MSARQQILSQVIEPNMADINRKLGQENDPRYLTYAVLYVLQRASDEAPKGESER